MSVLQKLAPILIVLTVVGLSTGGYFYYQYQKTQAELKQTKNSTQINTDKELIEAVGRLIELPEEDPLVATISDIDKLKDRFVFNKAKNGDKVLLYLHTKKAIVYDPEGKRIVDVTPFNIGSASAEQSIKIVLRNGTTSNGLTNRVEPSIKKSLTNANVVTKENASKTDYEKSVVVVLNDFAKDAASKLAKDMNVTVGELPSGESKPTNADLLVILGKDRI